MSGYPAKRHYFASEDSGPPAKLSRTMPVFRRKTYGRKRYVRKRYVRKRAYRRRYQPRPEIKYADGAFAQTLAGSTTTFYLLNGIAQGVQVNNRIGNQVSFTKFQNRFSLTLVNAMGGAPAGSIAGRIMLVLDKQPNGAIFAITDLLVAATTVSFNNLDNRQRFRVWKDMRFTLDASSNDTSINRTYMISKRLKTTYNLATNVVGAIRSNSVYMIIIFDAPTVAGEQINVEQYQRVRFVDC